MARIFSVTIGSTGQDFQSAGSSDSGVGVGISVEIVSAVAAAGVREASGTVGEAVGLVVGVQPASSAASKRRFNNLRMRLSIVLNGENLGKFIRTEVHKQPVYKQKVTARVTFCEFTLHQYHISYLYNQFILFE